MRLQPHPRITRRAAAAILLALAVAGCNAADVGLPTALPGLSGPATGSTAPGGTAGEDGSPEPAPSGVSTDPAVAWPAFAACLRAHGINVPDPVVDEQGEASWDTGIDFKSLMTRTTEHDCGPLIAALTKAPGRRPHSYTFDSEVAHSACLRDHGLTRYPDPDPNDSGGLAPGYDKGDPTVYAALVACESVLVEQTASPSPAQ